jgi:hypothetical protein
MLWWYGVKEGVIVSEGLTRCPKCQGRRQGSTEESLALAWEGDKTEMIG